MATHPPSPYATLNRLLDELQPYLLSTANRFGLPNLSLERWRWDEPALTAQWTADDQVSRNVIAELILGEPSERLSLEVAVEVNAWQDQDSQMGQYRLRRWRHQEVERLKLGELKHTEPVLIFNEDQLLNALDRAFHEVSRWKIEALENSTPIGTIPFGPW